MAWTALLADSVSDLNSPLLPALLPSKLRALIFDHCSSPIPCSFDPCPPLVPPCSSASGAISSGLRKCSGSCEHQPLRRSCSSDADNDPADNGFRCAGKLS